MKDAPRTASQVVDVDTPLAQLATQPVTLWMQSAARLQAESLRFIADRIVKGLRVPLQLGACATPVEALEVASQFAIEAARDYAGESQRLFAMAAGEFESSTATVI